MEVKPEFTMSDYNIARCQTTCRWIHRFRGGKHKENSNSKRETIQSSIARSTETNNDGAQTYPCLTCCIRNPTCQSHCAFGQASSPRALHRNATSSVNQFSARHCNDNSTVLPFAPTFFKLAVFIFILNNVTVSASPLLKRIAQHELRLSEYLQLARQPDSDITTTSARSLEEAIDRATANLQEEMSQTNFIEKLMARTTRSVPCSIVAARLGELMHHTYVTANKVNERTRRNVPMRVGNIRSWPETCKLLHGKLNRMYCDLERKHLFADLTDEVSMSLWSMVLFLRQEMNDLRVNFVGTSECDLSQRSTTTRTKFLNELFEMDAVITKSLQRC